MSLSDITSDIRAFLNKGGRESTEAVKLKGDMSSRQFWRIFFKNGPSRILMISLPKTHPNFSPGHNHEDYSRISSRLETHGLRVPEIFEEDKNLCLFLVEDLGDMTYTKCLQETNSSNRILTSHAANALERLREVPSEGLPDFMFSHVMKGHKRFVDWFLPIYKKQKIRQDIVESYLECWEKIFDNLPAFKDGFLHVDFHFGNLMWPPDQRDMPALLDFQGAMRGPPAYDLANLLQDARRDVSQELHDEIYCRYTRSLSPQEKESFDEWYPVLATHFHCRVTGQFIKMALNSDVRDYLKHIARLSGLIQQNIETHSILGPLKSWIKDQEIHLPCDLRSEDVMKSGHLISKESI